MIFWLAKSISTNWTHAPEVIGLLCDIYLLWLIQYSIRNIIKKHRKR